MIDKIVSSMFHDYQDSDVDLNTFLHEEAVPEGVTMAEVLLIASRLFYAAQGDTLLIKDSSGSDFYEDNLVSVEEWV